MIIRFEFELRALAELSSRESSLRLRSLRI